MSLDQLRQKNKEKVVQTALDCFVESGIFNTKISSVAKAAGLTERSVYRYFDSKADLVLQAALLFWEETVRRADEAFSQKLQSGEKGAVQIKNVLMAYASFYFSDRKKLIFIHEAEIYLHYEGKSSQIPSRPPASFNNLSAPLAKAIKNGAADGSVRSDLDLEALYCSAYDSLLGLMQKMAITNELSPISDDKARRRLEDFCEMLTESFVS